MQNLGFPNDGKPILVAVSGGVDSMVLASMLYEEGFPIGIAHCNYQLRGADSDADEALVRNWCAEHSIPFHLTRVETQKLAEQSNSSIQMVAREERYLFFEELMTDYGYVVTALAHHANDRVESLIMNVLRGTGFRGFQGMPPKRDNYIRPLLGFTKDEIRTFANENNVPFREDASNSKTDYQRNWIRLRVLPMLQVSDTNAFDKLLQLCARVESELLNYEKWIQERHEEMLTEHGVSIEKLQQSKAPFTILKELLEPKGFTSNHIFEVMEILHSEPGSEIFSDTHRVVKDRDELLISELNLKENQPILRFETLNRSDVKSLKTEPNVAFLDADKINQSELKTRKWQRGDKFKPLGMKGWKLLSDFFIDQKLSVPEKEQTWLLTFHNQIVWVIGMRIDDRFKITDSTQKVLKISAEL